METVYFKLFRLRLTIIVRRSARGTFWLLDRPLRFSSAATIEVRDQTIFVLVLVHKSTLIFVLVSIQFIKITLSRASLRIYFNMAMVQSITYAL